MQLDFKRSAIDVTSPIAFFGQAVHQCNRGGSAGRPRTDQARRRVLCRSELEGCTARSGLCTRQGAQLGAGKAAEVRPSPKISTILL